MVKGLNVQPKNLSYNLIMVQILIFFFLISLLNLLSQVFFQNFFSFWLLLTTSKTWAIRMTALFFLPGTLIHELAHFLFAVLLGVPTGTIYVLPVYEEHQGIRMGSVKIAQVDPFRRTLIGLAPLVVGILIIFFIFYFFQPKADRPLVETLISIVFVSSTMFSSKKDLEAAWLPLVVLVIIGLAIYWWQIKIPTQIIDSLDNVLKIINPTLLLTTGIQVLFILMVKILIFFTSRIFHRRLKLT